MTIFTKEVQTMKAKGTKYLCKIYKIKNINEKSTTY